MIYFFGIVSGILLLIFIAIYAMIEMHINYKKSIHKLKNSPESIQMAQRLHIIAELMNRMVITMIDIIAAVIGFGAVLIFPFVRSRLSGLFYSPANANSSSRDISANSSRFCVVLLYLENMRPSYLCPVRR